MDVIADRPDLRIALRLLGRCPLVGLSSLLLNLRLLLQQFRGILFVLYLPSGSEPKTSQESPVSITNLLLQPDFLLNGIQSRTDLHRLVPHYSRPDDRP